MKKIQQQTNSNCLTYNEYGFIKPTKHLIKRAPTVPTSQSSFHEQLMVTTTSSSISNFCKMAHGDLVRKHFKQATVVFERASTSSYS
ncbi:hypothetical protein CEXT_572901 [Caerostris extrusa]|uniref:Uncharacterized protein n=1 Tax=Caerostris extrusa TaxID=172846 RepID=A0AAV4TC27_CAEEX|nr:hypothetical protein CEXT_572901 [Caerostris extrusa]